MQRGAEELESQQESIEGLVTDKERKRKKKDTDSNVWETYRVQCARDGFEIKNIHFFPDVRLVIILKFWLYVIDFDFFNPKRPKKYMHENELKEEVSPVKQKFAEFSTSFLAFFARNFYNFKSAALIISFLLNLILLSLKWEAKGDAEDSDVAQETDFDQERIIIFVHLLNSTNSFS